MRILMEALLVFLAVNAVVAGLMIWAWLVISAAEWVSDWRKVRYLRHGKD